MLASERKNAAFFEMQNGYFTVYGAAFNQE
jgi:hypothetical protein